MKHFQILIAVSAGALFLSACSETTPSDTASLTPAAGVSSSERAGAGQFDATGRIACAQVTGQPTGQCEFGVAREGNGNATVIVTMLDGRKRAIFFQNGAPVGADTSQADGYGEFSATKESDLNFIRVGDERYEIPDAVVFGG